MDEKTQSPLAEAFAKLKVGDATLDELQDMKSAFLGYKGRGMLRVSRADLYARMNALPKRSAEKKSLAKDIAKLRTTESNMAKLINSQIVQRQLEKAVARDERRSVSQEEQVDSNRTRVIRSFGRIYDLDPELSAELLSDLALLQEGRDVLEAEESIETVEG